MSAWQQGDVLTNGIRMHYYRTGGDKPPVVLCHGGSDSGLCWTPVTKVLAADYDVIMIDARNHGLSETPPPSDTGSQSDDLAGLIMALGLDKPAVMGHSMGGGAAMGAAADHPELIGKVILEDSGPHDLINSPFTTPEGRQRMADEMIKLAAKSREEIIAIGHAQSPAWSDEELGPWADSKRQVRPETFLRLGNLGNNWRETIARIQCPMLVIHADNDKGSGVTPEEGRRGEPHQPAGRTRARPRRRPQRAPREFRRLHGRRYRLSGPLGAAASQRMLLSSWRRGGTGHRLVASGFDDTKRRCIMSEWQQGDVLTNGIRMHYYRTGGHKPPVVLCHGGGDSGLCYTPVARVLEADYDVIMIDARNHGLSETPPPSDTGSQGDDLAGLIVALGLNKPAVMGHSMGGGGHHDGRR